MERHATIARICNFMRNQGMNASVAVTEDAKTRSRLIARHNLIAVAMLLISPMALAAPIGGHVSAGTGAISQAGTSTTINQQSQNLAIDWNSFSIAANESVTFNQPNASAIVLNRVLGQDPSQIFGRLNANGQVFILNPNGVLFGRSAQVNVGGLVATTLDLSNADFMAGNYRFSNGGNAGSVINRGTIKAKEGGYIALLAPEVRNGGVITARLGKALLAAGNKVTLNLDNGSLLGYSVDKGALKALAANNNLIQADGGQVIMTAMAADALSTAVVNNTGIIEARTVQNIGGVIKLMGDMQVGQVNVGGTLNASAPNGGGGGFVETSAAHVQVADTARVNTASAHGQSGNWLIDPVDFTIAATGGNITGAALSTNLGAGNVTILSSNGTTGVNGTGVNGDVNVNDAVSWSANKLTLNAQRNINLNANLNVSGSGQLAFEYGQGALAAGNTSSYIFGSGVQVNLPAGTTNFTTKLGSNGIVKSYTVITSLGAEGSTTATDLQGMNGDLTANYVLGSNINAASTSAWNATLGFAPVGDNNTASLASQFSGTFDGLGHTISNLVVNRPTANYVGLFGYTASGSIVQNVGMVGGSISGNSSVGGLIGYSTSNVIYAYATNNISGNGGGTGNSIGGLLGFSAGPVSNSYATGNVNGNITATHVGGLVGNNNGTVNSSYATGSVSGDSYIGGLLGINLNSISNTYSTGNVSGVTFVGGLVGYNNGSALANGTINTSYSTGNVSGTTYTGGLVGINYNIISNSYWDIQSSGTAIGVGGGTTSGATGLTGNQMVTKASFAGWSIANTGGAGTTWYILEGYSSPLLTSFLKPVLAVAPSNNNSLAFYSAQHEINHINTDVVGNQTSFDDKLITVVNCGVLMPADAPSNLCQ